MTNMGKSILAVLPQLRRFTIGLTGNIADGDDLMQSAVARALERSHQYDQSYQLTSWLIKIAQNIWIDEMRKASRRGQHSVLDDEVHVMGEDGRVKMEQKIMTQTVLAAIRELPEDQRRVVALVLVSGHSYKEAAEMLDLPVGTVMSRLSRARQKLQSDILDHMPGKGVLQ